MKEFKIHKIRESEKYYITYNGHKITMSYMPKIFTKLTVGILWAMGDHHGKINNTISGRLIEFPTKEDAENAADYLCAKMVEEKLFE